MTSDALMHGRVRVLAASGPIYHFAGRTPPQHAVTVQLRSLGSDGMGHAVVGGSHRDGGRVN